MSYFGFAAHILGPDDHASLPDEATVPYGSIYFCTDHGKTYVNRAGTWTDWFEVTTGGVTDHGALTGLSDDDHPQYVKDSEFGAKGRILAGTGAGTFDDLPVGTNGHVLMAASGETTGLKYGVAPGTLIGYQADTTGNNDATPGTTLTDIDATNCAVTFTVPPSGNVLVRLTGITTIIASGSAGNYISWGLRESSSVVAGAHGTSIVHRLQVASATTNPYQATCMAFPITGLTPGDSKTYKWAWSSDNASAQLRLRAVADSPAIMEVIALP